MNGPLRPVVSLDEVALFNALLILLERHGQPISLTAQDFERAHATYELRAETAWPPDGSTDELATTTVKFWLLPKASLTQ